MLRVNKAVDRMRADMESAPTIELLRLDWVGGNMRTSTARPYGVAGIFLVGDDSILSLKLLAFVFGRPIASPTILRIFCFREADSLPYNIENLRINIDELHFQNYGQDHWVALELLTEVLFAGALDNSFDGCNACGILRGNFRKDNLFDFVNTAGAFLVEETSA